MDAQVSSVRSGALYIDVENFTDAFDKNAGAALGSTILAVHEALETEHGISIVRKWATARLMKHQTEHHLLVRQRQFMRQLRKSGIKLDWCCKHDADTNLKKRIYSLLQLGTLEETVVLMTGDGDFAGLVSELKATRRFVVVVGRQQSISKRLASAADRTLPLQTLVGAEVLRRLDLTQRLRA